MPTAAYQTAPHRAALLIALLAASFGAHAVTPFKMRVPVGPIAASAISIPGYNPLTGMFQSANGSFTWDGTAYAIPSGTAFGITGPVELTPAASASGAKTAMRLNPEGLAGTLAESWLAQEGMQWFNNEWLKTTATWQTGCSAWVPTPLAACQVAGACNGWMSGITAVADGAAYRCFWDGSPTYLLANKQQQTAPATVEDFDLLPDPLPAVGAELPYAPYMSAGAAVQNNFTITDLSTGTVHHCTNGGCD